MNNSYKSKYKNDMFKLYKYFNVKNKVHKQQLISYNRKMQESIALKQVTNIQNEVKKDSTKNSRVSFDQILEPIQSRPSIDQIFTISARDIDFGQCIPGSIHQKSFTIKLEKELQQPSQLSFLITCEDQSLFDSTSLIFGIKKLGQQDFYDDYRMKVKSKKIYEFKIGVKTPMYYQYDVKSIMMIHFLDYAPIIVTLKQRVQVPEIICTKQLLFEEARVIKLSVIQNRGKRQCRVPFKMNHSMTISVNAQLIGLYDQVNPVIDVKPKSMTLAGKGQFSLVLNFNYNQQIKQNLINGLPTIIRRILTLKIKQTKLTYHFPIEATFYPESKKDGNSNPQY